MTSTSEPQENKPPQMTIYLAPTAENSLGKVMGFQTPTEFREFYEKPENAKAKDELVKFSIPVPVNMPNLQPADGDLENGMKYLAFFNDKNYDLHDKVTGLNSELAPDTEEWQRAKVFFEIDWDSSQSGSDCSEEQRGHDLVIGPGCTGVYYLGDIVEEDGNAPSEEEVIETGKVGADGGHSG